MSLEGCNTARARNEVCTVDGARFNDAAVSLVCAVCGSTHVRWEALVHWNPRQDGWEIDDVFADVGYCERCGVDREVEARSLHRAPATLPAESAAIVEPRPARFSTPTCTTCGSTHTVSTACVRWDAGAQDFAIFDVATEASYCDSCEAMCVLAMRLDRVA